MKTIEIECRQIDEWDEATRKKIIEKHRDINTDYINWNEGVYEMWIDKLADMGYEEARIKYSGFWSQGDGASFTGKVNIIKWLQVQNNPKYSRILKLLENNTTSELDYSAEVTRHSSHYVHERTVSLQLTWYPNKVYDLPNVMSVLEDIEKDIDEDIVDQCQAIYKDLEEEYEGQTSDEAVLDTLRVNEYEMDNTGKIYH